jgi:hypothetical protein
VYVKTSPESTQEDTYCIDKYDEGFVQLKDALKAASADGERVTLSFHSYFSSGFKHCWTETAIVDGIVR